MKGLCIEDNLSSHKTDLIDDSWCSKLANFESPLFVPTNMTSYLQVVDKHIVIFIQELCVSCLPEGNDLVSQ
jgi:hypothetical protein